MEFNIPGSLNRPIRSNEWAFFFEILYLPTLKNLKHLTTRYSFVSARMFIWSVILSCICIYSNAQVHADLVASPVSGCAPLVVSFDDISTGNPLSWKWDLGNGTVSFLQSPSATYFNPGQYNIKLVVRNSQSIDSIIKNQLINVYASPMVNFSATPQSGCSPLPVRFTDLSTVGSGTITNREWDFGDGILLTGQNPQHTYITSGDFNVSLRITSSFGCISSLTSPRYIQISSGVHPGFTNTLPAGCKQPATIKFTNTSTGAGVLSYKWQFGDGSSSLVPNPSHTYSIPGSFDVTLIVFNSTGCSDTIIKPDLFTLGDVKADFSAPASACREANIYFLNTSKPVPLAAAWDFGDGTTSNSLNPVKVFANAGNFKVRMIANFGACKDSVIRSIQVLDNPVIDFTGNPTFSCKAPLTVEFSNITVAGKTFLWDFGDAASSELARPSHTYLKEGFYPVKLVVTNSAGCISSITKGDFIKIKSPVISISNLPQKGCAPLTHTFTADVNSVDPIINYHWDFGDGTTSALLSPTHTYTVPGDYTVSYFYSTSTGCTDTIKVMHGILVGSKPGVHFSALPRNVCAFTKINFTDSSRGNPNEWLWSFGDGSGSTVKNPDHQYNDTGYFSVTLIAINNGCADTLLFPDYIHIKPPVARFKYANICTRPGHVVFTDMSIGADTWSWDFGDGTSSTLQNPVHDYNVSGMYSVGLTVRNNTTGCAYTKIDSVNALKEIPDFTSGVAAVCRNAPVLFSAANSIPGNISLYTWRFGDGITVSGTSNSISHNYKASGSFNVTMILDLKNGCRDSIVKPLAIRVDGPTAVFRAKNPGACQNSAVTFIDSSYTAGTHAIQQWQWNWGDGFIQTLDGPVFQHIYTGAGNYSVSLKVTDTNGCTDSIRRTNTVVISKPIAAFNGDTLSCSFKGIAFVNASTGPALTYLWNFGDGTNSSQVNPVHSFTKEGRYTVSLAITDFYGCTDFISKANYVRIANPKANFEVSDTIGSCPPLVVNFTNNSINCGSWVWNFGDGTSSSSFNPSHFYAIPGTFNAVLTIKGPGGCTDQKSVQIKVKGPTGSFKYSNISGCNPVQTNFKATTGKNTGFIWDFNDGTTVVTGDSTVSHTFKTAGVYLPKMILVDANGCKVPVKGVDSIKVFEVFASFTNPATTLCDSGKVAFTNSSTGNDVITSHLWNFGDNTTSVLTNPVHNYAGSGNYVAKLFITSKNGCTDSVVMPFPLQVVKSPKISIGGSPGACSPALLTFTGMVSVPDTSALNWKWEFANGNGSTLQNPPSQAFVNAGSYSVRAIATNSSGCSDTAIKVIEAYALPVLRLAADTTLCKGASLALKASNAQRYLWSPSSYLSCTDCGSPVSRPDSAITYFVTGISSKGCVSTDSIFIDVKVPNTIKVSGPDTLCFGSSVQLLASGAEMYSWSPWAGLNNSAIASPLASPRKTTVYKVTGSDTRGCFTSTRSISVKVYQLPVVTAGADKTINVGQSFDIMPQMSADVTGAVWSPVAGIIARNYPGITVKPVQSTEYTIEVKNEGGCHASDKISIYVLCDNTNVYVPNTFSPNGDGANDVFYPRGSSVFAVRSLRIFNRWGEAVFERANFNANDASVGWDGTFKGRKLSPDVFVYALEVVCSNNQTLVFKGNVTLIR